MKSIGYCIGLWAKQKVSSIAIQDERRSISWEALDRRTNRLARAYAQRGVSEGDFVVVALPNSVDFYEAAIAAWKLGATPLPLSVKMPEIERGAILELVQPKLVIGLDAGDNSAWSGSGFDPSQSFSEMPLPDRPPKSWKAVASGGSTGRPKIIVSKDPGCFDPMTPAFGMMPDDVHLVAGPLYHNAAFMFSARALFCGNRLVIMRKFDAEYALEIIAEERVNYTVLVPTMMQRIWKLGDEARAGYDISSLRNILHTGAACPPWLKQGWIEWLGADGVLEVYGGTEGCGACWITGSEWLQKPGSVGRALAGFRVRVTDSEGNDLPAGEVGDIYMMPEAGAGTSYYYIGGTPNRTPDGWESIGDLGSVDADGYIFLSDRRTDLIISGGANVYPAEVEAIIDGFPGVRSNAVIGLPDDDLGARVHAIVDAPAGIDKAELLAHLERFLVRYKVPRSIEFVDASLRDDAGKVRRSALRLERIAQSTRQVASS
ncbi:putative acid-CoA ligase [Novosphingobium colocasiae]|uniref:Acid-CoA ligase n=2 Tax=Novosphingobium colocasiae TaxID=1256513 RepID=A0A918UKA6_9SPHN|nr:putative acid-CoA ligase [Novosphingobium colocasiae]